MVACMSALAQSAGGLRITPSMDVSLSALNTRYSAGAAAGSTDGNDLVAQVRPGLQMTGRLGRTRLSLDYGLNVIKHSQSSAGADRSDTIQNDLNAALNTDFFDSRVLLGATARVSQQSLSAFGQQSVDGLQRNSNRSEVSDFALNTSTRGSLAGLAVYDVSGNVQATHVKGNGGNDSTGSSLNLGLSSSGAAVLGWSARGSHQQSKLLGGGTSDSTVGTLSLLIRPDPELSGSVRVGRESTRVGSYYGETYNNWGADLRWTPTPRTSASISGDRRYFGNGYNLALDHRFARSSIRFSSSRDASTSGGGRNSGQTLTLYDLFFNQFASQQPDPALRELLVRDFLRAIGQDPNTVVVGGFVSQGVTLQRRHDLALSYTGLRATYTLQAFGSDTSRLDVAAGSAASLATRQTGLTSVLSYRLNPTASANLSASYLRTAGNALQAGNELRSISLSWSDRISRLLTTSVNARYSVFDGPINPYKESSLSATLGLRF